MTANRHPWVRAYRRSVRSDEIQHQFPPTVVIAPRAVAVMLVTIGTTQTAKQMAVFLNFEAFGMYAVRVTVRSVTTAMARMEKSPACTESCPTKPLTVHAVPGCSRPWRTKMMPETELFSELTNSTPRSVPCCERSAETGYQLGRGSGRAHAGSCSSDGDISRKKEERSSLRSRTLSCRLVSLSRLGDIPLPQPWRVRAALGCPTSSAKESKVRDRQMGHLGRGQSLFVGLMLPPV